MVSGDILGRIFVAMNKKGVSRSDVYENADLPSNAFSIWARRKTIPRADALLRIADYLGVSIRWLLTEEDEDGLNAEERDLLECYRSMNDQMKAITIKQMAILGENDLSTGGRNARYH